MRKFTKSMMTLALLCFAGVANAQEDEILDFDETFYHSWSEVSATATDNGEAGGGVKIGEEVSLGGTIWGNLGGSVPYLCYANITEYSELRFEGTPGAVIRLMCNRLVDEGPIYEIKPTIGADGKLTVNISDLKYLNGGTACDYVCLQSIKVPAGWQGGTTAATITSIKIVKPGDPLSVPKSSLKNAINEGKKQNALGKSTSSFGTLTTAISNGEKELTNASATAESLNAAAKDITDAIAALELADGYANLTAGMYKRWDDNYIPTTSSNVGCAYALNESTGQPYGDGSVNYLNFADVSDFSKLYVLGTAGTPRIMMNRREVGVSYNGIDGDSNGGGYEQIRTDFDADGKVEVDLTAYEYAHLNAIKEGSWGDKVTVTDMLLYRTLTIGATGYSTFGSINNSAKLNGATVYAATYAGGKVTLDAVTTGIVPAGKGVIVAGSGEIKPTFDVAAADIDTDLKVSNGTVVADGSTIYVLANGTNGLGFYRLQSGDKVPAGKAYLEIASPSREFIGIDGMSTGIQSVATEKADSAIYNLGGQRVANAQKGVYIVNGKKMVIK